MAKVVFSCDGVTVLFESSSVHVLRMDRGENLFNPELVGLLDQALDAIEATRDESTPLALVVTGTGKFFSNGLDLNWLAPRRL
jgi:enoyl-CoA hydratase/carnithine racemase